VYLKINADADGLVPSAIGSAVQGIYAAIGYGTGSGTLFPFPPSGPSISSLPHLCVPRVCASACVLFR
jgi:hypothetical protein